MGTESTLIKPHMGWRFHYLSEEALEVLWRKFSEIQCASWMGLSKEEISRFQDWIISGDDDDAWS